MKQMISKCFNLCFFQGNVVVAIICDGVWNHILHDYGSSKFHVFCSKWHSKLMSLDSSPLQNSDHPWLKATSRG